MCRKIISLIIALMVVFTAIPVTGAASDYRTYRSFSLSLSTPGLPQTIKCSFEYDAVLADILPGFTDNIPEGYVFPLASDSYHNLYEVEYTVENGHISFEYTLKPGRDIEDLYDALDSQFAPHLVSRGENDVHVIELFDAVLGFKELRANYTDLCSGSVSEQINVDGAVMIENGQTLSVSSVSSDLSNLPSRSPYYAAFDYDTKAAFPSQYKIDSNSLKNYHVFYHHTDTDGSLDWELVRAETDMFNGTSEYFEIGNRVLSTENSAYPFTYNVGIYNVKRGRFFDISECREADYPDLEAVWTEYGDGRLIGDLDSDNELTVTDVTIIQRCQAEFMEYPADDGNPNADSVPNAVVFFSDFDYDGDRSIMDATMIQRFLADMPHRTADWSAYEEPTEPMREPDDLSIPRITGFRSLGKGVEISIGTVPGAEKYRVYYKNENNNWVKMGETAGEPFIASNDVEVGKNYTYTVRCIKADLSEFTSDFDHVGWSYTYDPKLDTPQISRIEATNDGIKITWNPVEDADLYRVYYRISSLDDWIKIEDTTGTSITHTDAKQRGTNYYTVRCLSKDGKGFASEYKHGGWNFILDNPEIRELTARQDSISFRINDSRSNKIAVYRKEQSGWKRIDVVTSGKQVVDYDVEPGKTYTYTCRSLSEDGSYFVSRFNKSGWSQRFTLEECKPTLESFIYLDEDRAMVLPQQDDLFGIPKYGINFYDQDEYLGTGVINAGQPSVIRADIFKTNTYFRIYVFGLDENDNPITSYNEDGYVVKKMKPASNLRVKKIGDRKYRFRWDKANGEGAYSFELYRDDEEISIDEEYIRCLYYDVDLSAYPEDAHWHAGVWATTLDGYSNSIPIEIDFCESDFNSVSE